jgi:hypothetical protein
MKKSYLAFALAASLSGCGDPNTAQVDSFIQQMAQLKCDWEFHCCTDAEITQMDGRKFAANDESSCVPYRALELTDQLYIDRLAVREGRLRVDSDHASACLNQMQGMACNPMPGQPPPMMDPMAIDECAHVFIGNTPAGNECIYSNECVDGAHCVSDQLAVGRGVCVPFQRENDICNTDSDCDPKVAQLYCAKQDFKCHVRAKLGAACAYTTDSTGKVASLPLLLECDNRIGNVYCDPLSSTCRQLPADGELCLSPLPPGVTSQCDPDPTLGLVCDTTGGGTGTCRAPGGPGADCSQFACNSKLYCDTSTGSSVCTALPGLGQSCQISGYRCAQPYFCNTSQTPYTCDQPAQIGQSCSTRTCDTGLYCDPTRVCAARLPDGSRCTSFEQCLSDDCAIPAGGGQQVCIPAVTGIQCTGRQ